MVLLLLSVAEPPRRSDDGDAAGGRIRPFIEVCRGFRTRAGLLLPLYLGNAFLSIGDYGLLTWSPTFLARNFHFSPAAIGSALGGIAITTGIFGTAGGGFLADRLSSRFGAPVRLKLVLVCSLFALLGACAGLAPTASGVLVALAIWMLASAVSATVAIAFALEVLSNEMRGIGTALLAFCNTIIGLGLGPLLIAAATDDIFGDRNAVGLAMTVIVLPSTLVAIGLFYRALRAQRGACPAKLGRS